MNPQTESEKKILKDRIITQLYNSGIIQQKVDGICFRNHIHKDTRISEDIVQETFFHLSKKTSEEIISMYYDDGRKPDGCLKRLIGLSTVIAVHKGVSSNKSDPNYPKHSLAKYILFGSNFQQLSSLSPTEHTDDDDKHQGLVLRSHDDEEDGSAQLWAFVRERLTAGERDTLQYHLDLKKTQGRYPKAVKEKYIALLQRIEQIIVSNGIHT